jgi:16S rRNA (uracil1498-N3)-methyltransferase
MPPRRFYAPPERIRGECAVLPADEAHHLRHVLRLEAGSEVELIDGSGRTYRGIVMFRGPKVEIASLQTIESPAESRPRLTLALALIKAVRFEWALQKATELGVDGIIPIITRFGEVRISEEKIPERVGRWQRIVREAAKQCRRFSVPAVGAPAEFGAVLAGKHPDDAGFVLCQNARAKWPVEAPAGNPVVLCVGPEGGWHPSEIEMAERAGWKTFRLGNAVLRAETASIVAVALFRLGCAGSR